jgi:hypothetical protein
VDLEDVMREVVALRKDLTDALREFNRLLRWTVGALIVLAGANVGTGFL